MDGGAANPSHLEYFGHQRQFENLIHAIDTHTSPLVDGPEARKSVEIILAIYQSAHTGKRGALPL